MGLRSYLAVCHYSICHLTFQPDFNPGLDHESWRCPYSVECILFPEFLKMTRTATFFQFWFPDQSPLIVFAVILLRLSYVTPRAAGQELN